MKQTVLVAGATGNLGGRIVRDLIKRGATVRAVVRPQSASEKVEQIKNLGAEAIVVEMSDAEELKKACRGASCVISALSGLRETIVDSQTQLLDAAIAAGVPRFIPDDPDWKINFTTMDNTADYTAAVALDVETPRILRIASFQVSPNDLVRIGEQVTGKAFKLAALGSLEELAATNKKERAENPAWEAEVYPAWQGKQYLHSMFSIGNDTLDNSRYADVEWTSANEAITQI